MTGGGGGAGTLDDCEGGGPVSIRSPHVHGGNRSSSHSWHFDNLLIFWILTFCILGIWFFAPVDLIDFGFFFVRILRMVNGSMGGGRLTPTSLGNHCKRTSFS